MPADPNGRPRPRSLSQRITPSARSETVGRATGEQDRVDAVHHVAGVQRVDLATFRWARPRDGAEARIPPSGRARLCSPVAARDRSSALLKPRTAVRLARGRRGRHGARSIAWLARVVEGTYVSAMPQPRPRSPPRLNPRSPCSWSTTRTASARPLDRSSRGSGLRVLQAAAAPRRSIARRRSSRR